MRPRTLLFIVAVWSLAGLARAGDRWPRFRGPEARGISGDKGLPSTWDRDHNVLWKTPVPGRGWSSPIIWDGRVFLTTAVSEGTPEEAKKGLYLGGDRDEPVHRWILLAIDARSGKVLWERVAAEGKPSTPHHIKNTYASETPATDGERVYAYFGNRGLFAYGLDGEPLWSRDLGRHRMRSGWGTAASPVVHEGRVYVVCDNEEDSFLIAVDAATGEPVWRVDRDEKSNWATPLIWKNPVRTEIVTSGSGKVRSYDLSGKPLWELQGMSSITIPSPFAAAGLLYVASGFVIDPLRPVYAIRPGAAGDISLSEGATSSEHIAWCDRTAAPYNTSPLAYGGFFYTLFDRGFLACRDARTGDVIYDKHRFDRSANAFTASPWAYDGKVFCLSEDGDTFVVRAGPEFEVIGVNRLEEMCMATPAIAGGRLFIRTLGHLYSIGAASEPEETESSK